jgi:ABC-type oligopeptide transport system substrate-binding subunit
MLALAALVAALCLTACGGSPAGTYELDKAGMKAEIEEAVAANPDDPSAAMAASMIGPMLDSLDVTLTLHSNGSAEMRMAMMGRVESQSGTWTSGGDRLTLSFNGDTKTATWSDGRITLAGPDGRDLTLVRK